CQIVGQVFDLEVGHGGGGKLNAAIISGHPAGFTHWVRVNLSTTRGGAGFARKRSRIQAIFNKKPA
ncbi:MAG: hypothetical protein ACLGG1_09165, partial [Gammaproteobacteria bacterium]